MNLLCFFIGFSAGLIVSEFLPPDIVVKQGKVKNKNSGDLNNDQNVKHGLFRRIFKRKKK